MLHVLNHDGRAREAALYDALGEDVIAIPVEASRRATQLFEMAASRFGSFGLQGTTETKTAAVHFFPVPISQEVTLRSDCWAIESQVYPKDIRGGGNVRLRDRNHDMQPGDAFAGTQVSRRNVRPLIGGTGGRDGKRHALFASTGRETNRRRLPSERVRLFVVANGTKPRVGLTDVAAFLLAIKGRFEGFGCLDARLDEQIAHQAGTDCFRGIVHRMMQPNAILFVVLPTIGAHLIESRRELSKRLIKGLCLFRGWMQVDAYRSVHTKSRPYMSRFCKKGRAELPPLAEAEGYPLRRHHGKEAAGTMIDTLTEQHVLPMLTPATAR